jgi:hypothetical protein
VGKGLCAIKDLLPHGRWTPWLRENFADVTPQQARKYMRLYENWDQVTPWLGNNPDLGLETVMVWLHLERMVDTSWHGPPLDPFPGEDVGEVPPDPEDIPRSMIRMLQLYLDMDSFPEFQQMVKELEPHYGTHNCTETVLAVVRDAHRRLCKGPPAKGQSAKGRRPN